MSDSELYFADPADPTGETVLFDLQSLAPIGAQDFGFNVIDVEWGGVEPEVEWSRGPGIGTQASRIVRPVLGTIFLYSNYAAAVGKYEEQRADFLALAELLDQESVIAFRPQRTGDGSEDHDLLLVDTYPSDIAAAFRGQGISAYKLIERLSDPDGYPLRIWHNPLPRRLQETLADSVAIDNSVGGGAVKVTSTGSAESEARIEIAIPSGGANVVQARVGIRAGGDVDEFVADLSSFAITELSNPGAGWTRLWSHTLSPTDEDALIGTYRVLATVEFANDVYEMRMHWGWSAVEPLANAGAQLIFEGTDVGASDPVEIDLGEVRFERGAGQLVIQCWGRVDDGGNLAWGQATLMPADYRLITASVPGQRKGRFGTEVYRAEQLAEATDPDADEELRDNGTLLLSEQDQTATAPPDGGVQLPAGRHVVEMRGHVRNRDRTRVKVGELQVLEDGVVIRSRNIRSRRGQTRRTYAGDDVLRVQFESDGSSLYEWRAKYTETTEQARDIGVAALRRYFVPTIGSGRAMVLDGRDGSAYVADTDGARLWDLYAATLPMLPPGDAAIVIRLGDRAPLAYDSVDWREPLAHADPARAGELTVVSTPRELLIL